jgi:release factor glutamine methyltransferase
MKQDAWKLLAVLDATRRFFAAKQIENPRLQAELLLADVLRVRRLDLYLQFERVLETPEVDAYREHVKKRVQRIPLQYITGETGFRDLVFAVSSAALIPRLETEVLVGVALEYLTPLPAPRVLDLGCGAGAIGVSLAHEHQKARVVATDISAEALHLTRQNAVRNQVDERLACLCGDLFEPLRRLAPQGFDAIVSNPPYVHSHRLAELEPEVREHEPHLALDGGEDGLDYYRRIAVQASGFLTPEGLLFLEVGDASQAEEVDGLLGDSSCFEVLEMRSDLNDIPRVIASRNLGG